MGTVQLFNQTQNKVLYVNMVNMDFLPTTAPTSFSRASLTRPIPGEPVTTVGETATRRTTAETTQTLTGTCMLHHGDLCLCFSDLKNIYTQLGRHDILFIVYAENYLITLPK